MVAEAGAQLVGMSNFTDVGVVDVKTTACDMLLHKRVETKMRGKKVWARRRAAPAVGVLRRGTRASAHVYRWATSPTGSPSRSRGRAT